MVGYQCFGRLTGLIAGMVLAVHPGHAYYAMHFLSETPFVFWLTVAIAATLAAVQRGEWRWHVVAGGCLAMAVLTRPNMILILPLAFGLAVCLQSSNRRWA